MYRFLTCLAGIFCCLIHLNAQSNSMAQPRLIVGIVVDQMRYDYLYRYAESYSDKGFKRLLNEGLSCENNHYNFVPTYTGPGHACVYTGCGPALNGVIANEWWDREWGGMRYVTADPRYRTVGTEGKVGQHSPQVLLSSTITDELRLSNNFRSKVVGVCLKDRGSILPAGHFPNAAYWFDDKTGQWITSNYYPDSLGLPAWVTDFNAEKRAETYCNQVWDKQKNHNYRESFEGWAKRFDQGKYAVSLNGGFPHNLAAIRKRMGLGVLRFTPWGNTITLDFALKAIENMGMGTDEDPDFLCLSFSSPDYCAHQFGIHAAETEDMYLRLDLEIAHLLDYLDRKFGKDQVLVFLTADHGGGETPRHLATLGMDTDVFPEDKLDSVLNARMQQHWSVKSKFVLEVANQQVWFNYPLLDSLRISLEQASAFITAQLRGMAGVYDAFTPAQLALLPVDYPFADALRRGVHPKRTGDVLFTLLPGWHPDDVAFLNGGTTHGSAYAYDTHVPLIWYGNGIRPGRNYQRTTVSDIAPTLAARLRIMEPNANIGKVIERVME
jgi:predicted AlkP superfamily pyrophosphatase or phosphodiesterase